MTPPLGPEGERGLTILFVDDDIVDRKAVTRALRASNLKLEFVEVANAADALVAIESRPIDILIVDYFLPGLNGLELIGVLREKRPFLPVVVLTGQGDEALAARIMKTEGADYLSKNALEPGRLVQSLRYVFQYAQTKRREEETKRALERHARDLAQSLEEARAATRARDEVMAIVSHDLRNPLNNVSMAISMLKDNLQSGVDPTASKPLAERMERAVGRMNRLIDDLLDASRIDANTLVVDLQPVRAVELLDVGIEGNLMAAKAKDIRLERGLFDATIDVLADRDRINQVFSNLIGNAIKFTPQGGEVNLSLQPRDDGTVEFVVRDSGRGIPEDHLPHIFERFWKERVESREGAGLGLYIAHGIVRAHGGTMTVASALGRGSEFAFRLQRAPD